MKFLEIHTRFKFLLRNCTSQYGVSLFLKSNINAIDLIIKFKIFHY